MANWKIIKKISKNNLFTLGGHSLDHDILTKMNMKELDHNIIKTIEIIKNKTGVNVKHFSYPEGKFNNNVIKYLKNIALNLLLSLLDLKIHIILIYLK